MSDGQATREVLITMRAVPHEDNARVFRELGKAAQDAGRVQAGVDRQTAKALAERMKAMRDESREKVRLEREKAAASKETARQEAQAAKEAARAQRDAQREAAKAARDRAREQAEQNRRTIAGLKAQEKEAKELERQNARVMRNRLKLLDRIRRQEEKAAAERIKAEQRVAAEVERAQAKIKAANAQAVEGFKMGLEGAMQLARGLTLLGVSGEEDLQKVIQALAKVQAAVDITKGLINVVQGLSKAYEAYRATVLAAAAAQEALNAAQTRSGKAKVGGVASSAASGVASKALGGTAAAAGGTAAAGGIGTGGAAAAGGVAATAAAWVAAIGASIAALWAFGETVNAVRKYGLGGGADQGTFINYIGEKQAGATAWGTKKLPKGVQEWLAEHSQNPLTAGLGDAADLGLSQTKSDRMEQQLADQQARRRRFEERGAAKTGLRRTFDAQKIDLGTATSAATGPDPAQKAIEELARARAEADRLRSERVDAFRRGEIPEEGAKAPASGMGFGGQGGVGPPKLPAGGKTPQGASAPSLADISAADAKVADALEKALNQRSQAMEKASAELEAAQKKAESLRSQRQEALGSKGYRMSGTLPQDAPSKAAVEEADRQHQEALRKAIDLRNQEIERVKSVAEAQKAANRQAIEDIKRQQDAYKNLAKQLREQVDSAAERFGSLSPAEQARLLAAKQKLDAGQKLSREEEDLLAGVGTKGVSEDIAKRRRDRAKKAGFYGAFGGEEEQQAKAAEKEAQRLDQEVKLREEININIDTSADDLVKRLVDKTTEQVKKFNDEVERKYSEALNALEELQAKGEQGAAI